MPAEQPVHEGVPAAALKDPRGQSVQEELPSFENEPAGQFEHVVLEIAPIAVEAVPALHPTGAAPEPAQKKPGGHATVLFAAPPGQKMPAEHATGAAPAAQKKPAAHGTVLFVAPPAHWMPAGQETHVRAAELDEKVPARQLAHEEPPPIEAVPGEHGSSGRTLPAQK